MRQKWLCFSFLHLVCFASFPRQLSAVKQLQRIRSAFRSGFELVRRLVVFFDFQRSARDGAGRARQGTELSPTFTEMLRKIARRRASHPTKRASQIGIRLKKFLLDRFLSANHCANTRRRAQFLEVKPDDSSPTRRLVKLIFGIGKNENAV
jgi:hypothetical protein